VKILNDSQIVGFAF